MAESLINAILDQKPSTTLFHYTSQEGFLGILRSKTVWASNIHYLNDATEFSYAIELARSMLDGALRSEHGPFNDWYGSVLESIDSIRQTNIFAFALSEQGDLLSQWRGYCPQGSGFSIGFDYEDLIEPMERQEFRLIKCVYETGQHREIINELGFRAIDCLGDKILRQPARPAKLAKAVQVFLKGLISIAPAMKDPSFREEREWRLISGPIPVTHPSIRVRPGKAMMIPYFEFELATAAHEVTISTIHVGPNPHMYLSMASVVNALTASGIRCRDVRRSDVPYRGW